MNQQSHTRYYLAIVASTISVLGWLGVFLFGLYAVYLSMTGGPVYWSAIAVLLSGCIGAVFAQIEKVLHRVD